MIVTKKHLPRRTFIRGAFGAMVALPFLDAMVPALAAQAAARPMRFGAIYIPNGIYPQMWHPDTAGSDFAFKPIMEPLERYRSHLVTISGMKAPDGNPDMAGQDGRQRCLAEWRRPGHHAGEVHGHPVEEDD